MSDKKQMLDVIIANMKAKHPGVVADDDEAAGSDDGYGHDEGGDEQEDAERDEQLDSAVDELLSALGKHSASDEDKEQVRDALKAFIDVYCG